MTRSLSLALPALLAAAVSLGGGASAQTISTACPPDTSEIIYICTSAPVNPVPPPQPIPPTPPPRPPQPPGTPPPGAPTPVPPVPYPTGMPPGWPNPWPFPLNDPWWPFADPCSIAPDLCRPVPELIPVS